MYPAVQRAYLALSQADADSRHCILLTDGVPTPGDFDDVARRMAEAGITVSTVSLGQGADQTILKDISRIARGNHYHVDNPDDLPRILERETRTAAEKVTSDEFPVTALRRLPGLTVDDAPRLSNYVATNHKPKAQVLLTAGEGDPLLAWWRYGRGKAMVLTTDYSKSAAAWQNWSGNSAFWKRLVTYAMRDVQFGDTLHIAQHNGEVTVTLDAIQSSEDGSFYVTDGKAKLQMQPIDEQSGSVSELSMPHVAPGRYQATFAGLPGEQFLLTATLDGTIHGQRGVVIDYPLEYRLHHSDEAKLQAAAAVSGGQYAPTAEEIFAPDGRTVDVVHPLWPYVVIAAILLYLLETAIRRLPMHQPAGDVQARRRAA
mgnify:CR=1 FL=1